MAAIYAIKAATAEETGHISMGVAAQSAWEAAVIAKARLEESGWTGVRVSQSRYHAPLGTWSIGTTLIWTSGD